MGEEISRVCMCVTNPSISSDEDDPENKLISEYYSRNISTKEKEDILKTELKRLRKIRKSERVEEQKKCYRKPDENLQIYPKNGFHRSSNSNNSNNSIVNNHPYPSYFVKDFFAEEKLNMDASMGVNSESIESYSINATSNYNQLYGNLRLNHQIHESEDNEGEGDDSSDSDEEHNATSSPIYISPREKTADEKMKLYEKPVAMYMSPAFGKIGKFGVPLVMPPLLPC